MLAKAVMVGLLGASTVPAAADVLVLTSSSPEIEPGQWLRHGDEIETDEPVTLTVLPSGETQVRILTIPEGGLVYLDGYPEAETDSRTLIRVIDKLISTEKRVQVRGATRGGPKEASAENAACAFDPDQDGLDQVETLAESGCQNAARDLLQSLIKRAGESTENG